MKHLSDAVYAQAVAAATNLMKDLEARVLGKSHPGYTCCCGAMKHGEGAVVGISMSGLQRREHDFSLTDWIYWRVRIKENGREGDYHYNVGLNNFIAMAEIDELFRRHFTGVPLEVRIGDDRVWMGPSA